MPDDQFPDPDGALVFSDIAKGVVEKTVTPENAPKFEGIIEHALETAATKMTAAAWAAAGPFLRTFLHALLGVIEGSEPMVDDVGKLAVSALLGEGRSSGAVPDDVGKRIIEKLAPSGGAVEPSLEGAQRYLTTITHLNVEAWLLGFITEAFVESADWVRGAGGQIHSVAELREVIAQVMGGGRITRRVLSPFIDDGIVTPAKWATAKQYRPTLLSPSDAIRQFLRGRWTDAQLREELARLGFSDLRIDALLNAQRKFFSAANVRQFVERQYWSQDQGLQHLRDQGYDQETAVDAIRLEGLNEFEAHEATEASAIIAAYASRDIDRADFLSLLDTYIEVPARRALYQELGELRRQLNIKHLSASQAESMVKIGVLAMPDYRAALAREGYDDQAVTALELQLRFEMDAKKSIDDHRKALEAERAAEKAARDAAAAARKAEVEADRALKRRGSLSDLTRAAVRGLIPFSRVEEVLGADYDPDTVDILVGLMEQDRQTYLAQQAAAEEARKKAARRDIDVGTLEQAVYDNLLTVDAFRQRLALLKFSADDAQLLGDVVAQRKADLDAAKAKHDDAETQAKIKHIDLGRFERLVRLGARSLDDYDELLAGLGYDDPARAAMTELLQLEIAKDRAADDARKAAEAKLRAKGLSLEQFRRAVVLGHKTVDDYNAFLVNQGFTADAIATLVAEVVDAVKDAEDARRKRAAADAAGREPTLPLSTVARAARLGIIAPADYATRLEDAGYSADDVAIEMELLATEIADVQAARARRDLLAEQTGERGLTLKQLEAAVKAGDATVDDYQARAFSLNYSADDVALLVALLDDELAAKASPPATEQ